MVPETTPCEHAGQAFRLTKYIAGDTFTQAQEDPMKKSPLFLTQAAVIAAAYIVLTLPFAQFAFGQIQFRLAEALTVLAALTPAAIPGLFIGCLLTNAFFNPSPLGLVDILLGSTATLIAAVLTWGLSRILAGKMEKTAVSRFLRGVIILLPPVVVNAVVVGTYLPYLIMEETITLGIILGFVTWIFISEAIVVYLIGWPVMQGLKRANIIRIP
jgi:uncharacterized membrane protein